MPDLRDLYQEVILDHSRRPQNYRVIEGATGKAEGFNPLCGDRVTVYLDLGDDRVRDISFQGQGCSISKASASLMTAAVRGKTRAEAEALFDRFHEMVTGAPGAPRDAKALGKLAVFSGIAEFPTRVKCAVLPWHTLRAALASRGGTVTTE